ncbi:MAG: biotin/lipoyl-binding protein [Eubacteriales bacterium]|nr:biotin/lipoyl-binding protein [Eubacteriales bacterium]
MKKKIAGIFAGFLALMILFTFLSRAADSMTVARVSAKKTERGKIPHQVTGTGKVVQNREQAVSTLAGQTVKSIYVEEGQKVSEGDVLYEIDLESLKEQILIQKQEMKKADLQSQDKASSRDAEAYKNDLSRYRAAEDYSVAAGKGSTAVERAAAELSRARKKLKSLNQSEGSDAGEDSVEKVLKEICEQKKEEYEEAVKYKEELEKAIEEVVKKALSEAANDTARLVAGEHEMHMTAQEGLTETAASPGTSPVASATEEPAAEAVPQQPGAENLAAPPAAETPVTETPITEAPITETQPQTSEAETYASEPPSEESTVEPSQTEPEEELILGGAAESGENEAVSPEAGTGETEDLWLLEQRIRIENQPLLDEADILIRTKEQEKKEADAALAAYQQEKAAGTQMSLEEMKEQINEEIRAKQQAYEDAVTAANDSLRTAGRAVEDANAPQGTDSTGEIDAITREQEELKLEKLERLLEAEGKVTSPIDASVTKINLITGEKTPDGTAILLSDTEAGNKLVVQIPEDQEKYIAKGDEVKVKTNSKDSQTLEGLTVDNVQVNDEDQDLLDVTVQLPADSLEAGVSAVMEATRVSDTYDCCIPIQALYEDSGKYYVYVIGESSSVLGTELTARRVDVTVLEKNETDAALQTGSISGEQQVIVSSDKALSDGSRVRLLEG